MKIQLSEIGLVFYYHGYCLKTTPFYQKPIGLLCEANSFANNNKKIIMDLFYFYFLSVGHSATVRWR
jgi:hypothetical protein